MATYADNSPEIVNSGDVAGNTAEEEIDVDRRRRNTNVAVLYNKQTMYHWLNMQICFATLTTCDPCALFVHFI